MPRRELCPASCLFASDENEGPGFKQMCDVDCKHSRDQMLEDPEPVEVKKWGNEWGDGEIIATNGEDVYIKESGTIFSILKRSPLIRKK